MTHISPIIIQVRYIIPERGVRAIIAGSSLRVYRYITPPLNRESREWRGKKIERRQEQCASFFVTVHSKLQYTYSILCTLNCLEAEMHRSIAALQESSRLYNDI